MENLDEDRIRRLEQLNDELNRRQDGQLARLTAVQAQSGVLIASSALVAAFLAARPLTLLLLFAVALSLAAAVLGALALMPRPISEIDGNKARKGLLTKRYRAGMMWLTDHKIGHIERRENTIRVRYKLARVGLLVLGGALALLFLDLYVAWCFEVANSFWASVLPQGMRGSYG